MTGPTPPDWGPPAPYQGYPPPYPYQYRPPPPPGPFPVFKPSKGPRIVGIIAVGLLVLCGVGVYAAGNSLVSTQDQELQIVDAYLDLGAPAGFVNDRVNSSIYPRRGSQEYDLVCQPAPQGCPTDPATPLADWATKVKFTQASRSRLTGCTVPCLFTQRRDDLILTATVSLFPQARNSDEVAASVVIEINRS